MPGYWVGILGRDTGAGDDNLGGWFLTRLRLRQFPSPQAKPKRRNGKQAFQVIAHTAALLLRTGRNRGILWDGNVTEYTIASYAVLLKLKRSTKRKAMMLNYTQKNA